jgi:hypothetical protein
MLKEDNFVSEKFAYLKPWRRPLYSLCMEIYWREEIYRGNEDRRHSQRANIAPVDLHR